MDIAKRAPMIETGIVASSMLRSTIGNYHVVKIDYPMRGTALKLSTHHVVEPALRFIHDYVKRCQLVMLTTSLFTVTC